MSAYFILKDGNQLPVFVAQADADLAAGYVAEAAAQVGLAAAQVGLATAQAGIATTEAGIATTQAGISTTEANAAHADRQAADADVTLAHNDRLACDADAASALGNRVAAEAAEAGVEAAIAGAGGTLSTVILSASTRTLLAAMDTSTGLPAWLDEDSYEGMFDVISYAALSAAQKASADGTANVEFVRSTFDSTKAWRRRHNGVMRPWGAKGDDITNDTLIFQDLGALINDYNGGVIALDGGATYVVGLQDLVNDGTWMFKGRDILAIDGCSRGVSIIGNGAKFRLADGLKFGTLNSSGSPTTHTLPYSGGDASAPTNNPNCGIITITNCTGPILITNVLLDGNAANLVLGGPYGDTGYQLPGDGLMLAGNSGPIRVHDVRTTMTPRDGMLAWGTGETGDSPPVRDIVISSSDFTYSCRNNVSLVGGAGWKFMICKFLNAGRGPFSSAPASCFDLEAESGSIRDVEFADCVFSDGLGTSMVADSGDTARIQFNRCRFSNHDSWAAWFNKPYMKCRDCFFFGPINLPYAPSDPELAVQFVRSRFSDNNIDSYSGVATAGWGGASLIQWAGGTPSNAYFGDCVWDAGHFANAAQGTGFILENARMSILTGYGAALFNPTFIGVNSIHAPSPPGLLNGTVTVEGVLLINGALVYGAPPILDGNAFYTAGADGGLQEFGNGVGSSARVRSYSPVGRSGAYQLNLAFDVVSGSGVRDMAFEATPTGLDLPAGKVIKIGGVQVLP